MAFGDRRARNTLPAAESGDEAAQGAGEVQASQRGQAGSRAGASRRGSVRGRRPVAPGFAIFASVHSKAPRRPSRLSEPATITTGADGMPADCGGRTAWQEGGRLQQRSGLSTREQGAWQAEHGQDPQPTGRAAQLCASSECRRRCWPCCTVQRRRCMRRSIPSKSRRLGPPTHTHTHRRIHRGGWQQQRRHLAVL